MRDPESRSALFLQNFQLCLGCFHYLFSILSYKSQCVEVWAVLFESGLPSTWARSMNDELKSLCRRECVLIVRILFVPFYDAGTTAYLRNEFCDVFFLCLYRNLARIIKPSATDSLIKNHFLNPSLLQFRSPFRHHSRNYHLSKAERCWRMYN